MPRDSLTTIYKSFIRPHLNYADVIFDKPSNATFSYRIESAKYNVAIQQSATYNAQYNLEITGTIGGTSKKKLYQELGFETMKKRRWFRRPCSF